MAQPSSRNRMALSLGALGIVYGDIGTSPLYALKEVFVHAHIPLTEHSILGVLSLVFWTLTIVVSLKYVYLILNNDNRGEGGLIAMMTLATQAVHDKPRIRHVLLLLGLFGTALFCGDGIITPAVSVLSAVEGLELISPHFHRYIIPITLVILLALFAAQRKGTAGIARFFGPVMLLWFVVLGILGISQIIHAPQVLRALNPLYALEFFTTYTTLGFLALGAVVLCVTGAEALYADLGHFGRTPIRIAWYGCAMPGLLLNYFGQGAYLMSTKPDQVGTPFFQIAPSWALVPLVCLATVATIIASQALITGAFSCIRQAIQLGFLPRMRIMHTSIYQTGQIYIPVVNWSLFAGIVVVVLFFKSSGNLAAAYGIAVTLQMLITTLMSFFVIRYGRRYPLWLCLAATIFFISIDLLYFSSNILKFADGGWLPILVASLVSMIMLTWMHGKQSLNRARLLNAIQLPPFLDAIFANPPSRVEGTAVFMNNDLGTVPLSLLHNLKHNKVIHATNLFVYVDLHEIPWVGFNDRIELKPLGHDCWQVTLNYGFKNEVDIPEALKLLSGRGIDLDPLQTSYFFSRENIVSALGGLCHMMPWRKKLFATLYRNAEGAADFYNIPANRVIELGSKVEI